MATRQSHYNSSYRNQLREKIAALPGEVFKRSDLQVEKTSAAQLRLTRALQAFIDQGAIVKISHGLYAKAQVLTFENSEPEVALQRTFADVAMEALDKLGVQWELGSLIQQYNRGEIQQIPVRFTVRLKSRFRGHIEALGRTVYFEERINAR